MAKKTFEFPLIQIASIVFTLTGFFLFLYFSVLLNSLSSASDTQDGVFYYVGAYGAIPNGEIIIGFGLCFILVGIILNAADILIKKREKDSKN